MKGGIDMEEAFCPLSAEERDAYQRLPFAMCIFEFTAAALRPFLISDGMCALLESSRADLFSLWQSPEGPIHPDDAAQLRQTDADAIENCGRLYSAVFRITVRNGTCHRLFLQEKAVRYESGVCLLFCQYAPLPDGDFLSDDSPEAALLKNENARLTRILDNVPSGIAVFQVSGDGLPKSVSINRYMAQSMDLPSGNLDLSAPEKLWDYVHPDDWTRCKDEFSRFLKTGAPLEVTVRLRRDGTGTYLWAHIEGNLMRHADGSAAAYVTYVNVDAMKQTESDLLNSRRIYENAVRSAQLMMWEYDIPHRRITFSQDEITQAECEKFDLPPVLEDVPESLSQWFDQRDFSAVLALHRQVISGKDATCDAWYRFHAGQEPRCERISYTVVRDSSGNPVLAYGLGRNITVERKIQERYQREMDYLKQNSDYNLIAKGHDSLTQNRVLEYTPLNDKAYSFVPNRTYDEACAAFLGTSYSESERKSVAEVINRENLIRRYQLGETRVSVQYRRAMHGRPPFWVSTVIHTYATPDTGDIEIFTYTYDITRHKQNEEIMSRIAETEFDYIGILYALPRTFEFVRKDRRITYPKLHEKTDYELLRQYVRRKFVTPDEQAQFDKASNLEDILAALNTQGRHSTTYKRMENGRPVCVQLNFSWLEQESGSILVVRTNVTAAYEREQQQLREVQRARLEAMRANEAKSVFLSSMSHDLRTPLNGVLGFAERCSCGSRTRILKKQKYLEKIHFSGGLLLDLVNDTLELSRIESGKMVLEQEPVNGKALCETVLTALRPSASRQEIRLTANALRFPGKTVVQRHQIHAARRIRVSDGGNAVSPCGRPHLPHYGAGYRHRHQRGISSPSV
jgi:signal transduction histidine kinase